MERPADSLDPGRPAFCDRWACSFHCALSGTWSCPCHAQVLLPQSSVQGTQTNVNIQSKTPEGWKVLVRIRVQTQRVEWSCSVQRPRGGSYGLQI